MTANKYKVGDKVLIRSDLVSGKDYGTDYCTNAHDIIKDFLGRVVTISKYDKYSYKINEIPENYSDCYIITDEMIVGLADEIEWEVGDLVEIVNPNESSLSTYKDSIGVIVPIISVNRKNPKPMYEIKYNAYDLEDSSSSGWTKEELRLVKKAKKKETIYDVTIGDSYYEEELEVNKQELIELLQKDSKILRVELREE